MERVRGPEGVAQAAALPAPPDADVTVIQVVPTTSPQSEETDRLIDTAARRGDPARRAIEAHVGGVTAVFKDFATVTGDRLPYFVATIIALGFVLLLVAFRSFVVPLTAALMNLIAAAASFGVLVAIFQWGWGRELLGLGKEGPITAFLPVIMLSLLFGLSMDYQVFLVSRMHEEWVHTRDNARAVRVGLAETSRVINCAALIMICVFRAFVLSGDMEGRDGGHRPGGGGGAGRVRPAYARWCRPRCICWAAPTGGCPAWLDRRLPHLAVEPSEEETDGPAPDVEPEQDPTPEPSAEDATGQAGVPGVAVVHGFVRTDDGGRVADAVLTLMSAGGRQLDRVRSLADGSYILSAPGRRRRICWRRRRGCTSRDARHIMIGDEPLVQDLVLTDGSSRPGPTPAGVEAGHPDFRVRGPERGQPSRLGLVARAGPRSSRSAIPGRKSVNSSCTSRTSGRSTRNRASETPRAVSRAPRSASRWLLAALRAVEDPVQDEPHLRRATSTRGRTSRSSSDRPSTVDPGQHLAGGRSIAASRAALRLGGEGAERAVRVGRVLEELRRELVVGRRDVQPAVQHPARAGPRGPSPASRTGRTAAWCSAAIRS